MKQTRQKRDGRRPIKPIFNGPIPENPDYRRMVEAILAEKRRIYYCASCKDFKLFTAYWRRKGEQEQN